MKAIYKKLGVAMVLSLSLASCTVVLPVTASRAELGSKKGISSTNVILGYETNKNFGVKDAAKNGNITSAIATVDVELKNLILFQKKKLIVTAK